MGPLFRAATRNNTSCSNNNFKIIDSDALWLPLTVSEVLSILTLFSTKQICCVSIIRGVLSYLTLLKDRMVMVVGRDFGSHRFPILLV